MPVVSCRETLASLSQLAIAAFACLAKIPQMFQSSSTLDPLDSFLSVPLSDFLTTIPNRDHFFAPLDLNREILRPFSFEIYPLERTQHRYDPEAYSFHRSSDTLLSSRYFTARFQRLYDSEDYSFNRYSGSLLSDWNSDETTLPSFRRIALYPDSFPTRSAINIRDLLAFFYERYPSLYAHADKNLIPCFFYKLLETSDFKRNPNLFMHRVREILELAEKHPNVFYIQLSQALESCEDRTIHELDNIECALRAASCDEMPLANSAQFLLKCHRLHRLNAYVAKECGSNAEAIETSLALRIFFQSDLPVRAQSMRYDALSKAQIHCVQAGRYIFKDNNTVKMKASVLCQNEYWTNQLSQDEIFQKDLEKLSDNLSNLSANDAELLSAAENAQKAYKTLQIQHTIRILNLL